jgi:hypothetical protein
MALNLKSLKNNGGGNGGGPKKRTIAVELVRVDLKDPKKATPGEDVGVFLMRHPADGFPEFTVDENGVNTTEIRMTLEKHNYTGDNAPLLFSDYRKGKGQSKPVPPGSVVILEGATYDIRKNQGQARWQRVATHGPESATEYSPSDYLMSVGKESYQDVDGERRYRQLRYLAVADEAQAFTSLEQFKQIAADGLIPQADIGGDKPAVWVRILNTKDPVEDRVTTSIRLGWKAGENGEDGRQMTPEESVENFLNSPAMADWVDNISQAGKPDAADYLFEVIPHFWWYTGEKSLPKGKPKSDSNDYQIAVENSDKSYSGFAASHAILKRKITPAMGDDAEEIGNWFATSTVRTDRFGPLFPREELITPNLPAEVKAKFEGLAKERGAKALATMLAAKNPQTKADAAGEDLAFGEPDHDNRGVTPR